MDNIKIFGIKKSVWLWVLMILGFIVTIDLAYIYYQANFNQNALPSFCVVNDFIDCDGVAKTTESQFFGVPLAYWGLFLYAFMMILMLADKLKNFKLLKFLEVFKNKYHYIATLGIISFIISMSLLGVSLMGIHKLCIMCAVTYVINLFIGLVSADGIEGHFLGAFKQSVKDFADALKPISYRIAFIVVMICACGFLTWTYESAKFSPALQSERNFGEFAHTKINKYSIKGNILGSDAKDAVVLEVYSDYKCPICAVGNRMVHKLVRDFTNVRVEHKNLPLDTSCNKNLKQPFHQGSCILAQYGLTARNQGKFWEVESLLFDVSPSTESQILELLKNSGFGLDMDKLQKDAHSIDVEREIQADINYAMSRGMIGTPAMKLDNDFQMGMKGYTTLKEWVIKHGGQPKHHLFE